MIPSISQVCALHAPFEEGVQSIADAAGSGVEVWLTKLEHYLETQSADHLLGLCAQRGLKLVAAAYQGGLLLAQGEARRVAWEQFERRLDLLARLQIPVLVLTADFLGPFNTQDIERAQVSLHQGGELAAARNVQLALEFQARHTFLNNLETAISFTESVQLPNVGVCLDLFHFMTGPSKFSDLAYLHRGNLKHVQVCDVADRPRELATDSDRILPGDGDFPLSQVFDRLRELGYEGAVSLELLNPHFWSIAPPQLMEISLTALRKSLGLAESR